MTETFYDALGVDEDATTAEIESAYRAKVKETHPDVSDAPDAQERFKHVKRAKEVLADAQKRERYDRMGHEQYVNVGDGVGDGSQYSPSETETADEPQDASTDHRRRARANATTSGRSRTTAGSQTGDPFERGPDRGRESTTSAATNGATGGATGTTDWDQSTSETGGTAGTTAYATRTSYTDQSIDRVRVPLTPGTLIQIGAMFVLYPVFLLASVFPLFPTVVNVLVGLCTLFVVAYLLSIPEVAIVVFGAWSVLTPLLFVSLSGLTLLSLWGIGALVASWFPLGLALLTQYALRT